MSVIDKKRKKYLIILLGVSLLISIIMSILNILKNNDDEKNKNNLILINKNDILRAKKQINSLEDHNKKMEKNLKKYKNVIVNIESIEEILKKFNPLMKEMGINAKLDAIEYNNKYINVADASIIFNTNEKLIKGYSVLYLSLLSKFLSIKNSRLEGGKLIIEVYRKAKL